MSQDIEDTCRAVMSQNIEDTCLTTLWAGVGAPK